MSFVNGASKFQRNLGFTLIEIIVVTTIIAVLAVAAVLSLRGGSQLSKTQRAARLVSLDIRRVQNITLATREEAGDIPFGYGIVFTESDPKTYEIFVDRDDDMIFDRDPVPSKDELFESVSLPQGSVIRDLRAGDTTTTSVSRLLIYFCPPDPTTFINPAADPVSLPGGCFAPVEFQKAEVVVGSEKNPAVTSTITIFKEGLVETE